MLEDSVDPYLFRLCALRAGLKLERQGMRRRGRSAYAIVKREFGFKGNREAVYTQLCEVIEHAKSLSRG